jgi:hypothetical protein
MAPAPKTAPEIAEQNGRPAEEPWLALPLSVFQDIEEVLTLVKAERTLSKIRQHLIPATFPEEEQ